jgi:hypothetical protein
MGPKDPDQTEMNRRGKGTTGQVQAAIGADANNDHHGVITWRVDQRRGKEDHAPRR